MIVVKDSELFSDLPKPNKTDSGLDTIAQVFLPASVFQKVSPGPVEVVFSMYPNGVLFPFNETENSVLYTPVVSASVAKETIKGLEEPVVISFKLRNVVNRGERVYREREEGRGMNAGAGNEYYESY